MFAYCNNSPVNDVDPSGHYGICVLNDPMNVNRAFMMPGMFGGGGGAGGCVAGVSSSYYASQNVKNYDRWWRNSGYNPNANWSTGTISGFTGGNTGSDGNGAHGESVPTYPSDPNDFNPKGLVKKVYVKPGTGKNGGVIKWEIPGTKIAVFEWNEDYINGPHYHAMLFETGNAHINHFHAGDIIETPWDKYF